VPVQFSDRVQLTGIVTNVTNRIAPLNTVTYGGFNYNPLSIRPARSARFYELGLPLPLLSAFAKSPRRAPVGRTRAAARACRRAGRRGRQRTGHRGTGARALLCARGRLRHRARGSRRA